MANILFVIAPRRFRDREYFVPKQILEKNGHTTQVASTIIGDLEGTDGGTVSSTMRLNEVNIGEFDGVVFVGGPGMVELTDNIEMTKLAKDFYASGRLTAAICVAPAILAKADLIQGKRVTAWAGAEDDLKDAGGIVTKNKVETDKNIITADGPSSAEPFANEIMKYFRNRQETFDKQND